MLHRFLFSFFFFLFSISFFFSNFCYIVVITRAWS